MVGRPARVIAQANLPHGHRALDFDQAKLSLFAVLACAITRKILCMTGSKPAEPTADSSFAQGLAAAMKAGEVSTAALAYHVSVSQATVSRWLRGKIVPRDEVLAKIGAFLPPEFGWLTKNVRRQPKRTRQPGSRKIVAAPSADAVDLLVDNLTLPLAKEFIRIVLRDCNLDPKGTLSLIVALADVLKPAHQGTNSGALQPSTA